LDLSLAQYKEAEVSGKSTACSESWREW